MDNYVAQKWTKDIVSSYSVPTTLHPWQEDSIRFVIEGESVALCVPTGAGKTLPQLAASLFFSEGVAIVIPPLISIENQLERVCAEWNIPYLNISSLSKDEIMTSVASSEVKIVIASIEQISDVAVQKAIRNLKVNYISVDECQVMDSENGWTSFRPYVPLTWNFLRANYKAPFLLCSAPMEDVSLNRIFDSSSIHRSKVKILYKSPDRADIYQQLRVHSVTLDVGNIDQFLGFVLPIIADSAFSKCQIFSTSKHINDMVAAWLKMELETLNIASLRSGMVEKLSGDNSKGEKLRVMERFKSGECKILVSTDVAGMGTDVPGLNLVINLGVPKTPWKFLQQCGRAGREGQSSVAVTIKFPVKGRCAPEACIKNALSEDECLRLKTNNLFMIDGFKDYTNRSERFECMQIGCDVLEMCDCEACTCCSTCTNLCPCVTACKDPDSVLKGLLELGDANYSRILQGVKSRKKVEESDTESCLESDSEEERVDELELSLVDLTPQFASLLSDY